MSDMEERRRAREARRRRNDDDDDESGRRDEDEAEAGGDDDDDRRRQEEDDRRREEEERRRREEAAAERQRKQEEKEARETKEREEAEKKNKNKGGQKRKGLGGLSPEKRKLLKALIMQKAAEEMKAEARKRQEVKENHLKKAVGPLEIENLDQNGLENMCKKLHDRIAKLEGEKYDWEIKIMNQEYEINELTIKTNDIKGKFVKPVLKKVSKTESKLARFDKKETSSLANFREQLKSTGQNKYALEEKEDHKTMDWQDQLKSTKDDAAVENGAAEVTAEA